MSQNVPDVSAQLGQAPNIDFAAGAGLSDLSANWDVGLGSFLPPSWFQEQFVGSSGSAALDEGVRFVGLVTETMQASGRETSGLDVLDFAAGWGRIARALVPFTHPGSLWCAELLPLARAYCAAGVPGASVVAVSTAPPTKLADKSFDLITGYSIFTHLPKQLHEDWVAEFARLVRAGGTVAVTYWDHWFLELCEDARQGKLAGNTQWHKDLARRFDPHADHMDLLAQAGHLFVGSGGGDGLASETYGEAAVTRDYVEQIWAQHGGRLELWDDRRQVSAQAVAVISFG